MTRFARGGLELLLACFVALVACPALAAFQAAGPLHVVTKPVAPFVLPGSGPPSGFSVDLWNEVAHRMGVESSWSVRPPQSDLVEAVRRGEADVAIAAIAMTSEGEKLVDFSHAYFDSGLQIMVRARTENRFFATLHSVPWLTVLQFLGAAVLIYFALANVLWLIERRSNPEFQKTYVRALGEALWGTMLIIATGEHGDRNAPGVLKRATVASMWLLGVVLIAQLTATVTASQTVQRLQSIINGPEDLPGKSIATLPESTAAEYLSQRSLAFRTVNNGPDAIRMLERGEVQAIVFEAPTVQYWVAQQGGASVEVVGPVFQPEKLGMAVAEGSPLRKRINLALLEAYQDGTYEKIRAKWFSRRK
jgi:polar amino acid transport system substrate-binding protein